MGRKVVHQVGYRGITNSGFEYTVVERLPGGRARIKFDPPYEGTVEISAGYITRGGIRNPFAPNKVGGILGEGKYNCLNSTKIHNIWYRMLERVFHWEKSERNKSYEGCSVYSEWKNFQVFAEWYYQQKGCYLGWHLEKDLLVRGNKTYSPETCVLVPMDVNMFLTKRKSCRDTLIGVAYRAKTGRYLSAFTRGTKNVFLGSYATEIEAHLAYKAAKEDYAKVLAEKYKDVLDSRAYLALANYEVHIDD